MFTKNRHQPLVGQCRLLCAAVFLFLAAWWPASRSIAADGGHSLGAGSQVTGKPLQELIKRTRAKGKVFLAIPQALMYGEGTGQRPYCSPQIRATNSSHLTVEELIVGIRYKGAGGKNAGTSVTRFFRVKVGKQETHYFYSTITAPNCKGLTGEVEIVRCVYDSGDDCSGDVYTVEYGAIPLRIIDEK
ncbi:MAG TPA: hypothetical protein VGE12_05965 [Noviherbaspirillum sp.]